MAMKVEDKTAERDKDYSQIQDVQKQLDEVYRRVCKGFEDKQEQTDRIRRYWDIYNCTLNEETGYEGNSRIFLPIVRDAVEARQVRFMSILFPQNDRTVSVLSAAGPDPRAITALVQHRVNDAKVKSVLPQVLRAGDVTGQYSVYLSWHSQTLYQTYRMQKPAMQAEGVGVEGTEIETIVVDEEVKVEGPDIMPIATEDLCVLPSTASCIEDAEVVAVRIRMSKEAVRKKIRDGDWNKAKGEIVMGMFGNRKQDPNPDKKAGEGAGVKTENGDKVLTIYQIWTTLKVNGERRRYVSEHAGDELCVMCKRNPHWSDKIPILSYPRGKVAGAFWGESGVSPVEQLQYAANDAANMGWDSAQYSLLPIVMTDPVKNPRVGSMVLAMAAVWETSPADTKIVEFPQLWKDALTLIAETKNQIFQSLSVNPAMMPQGNQGKKPTQSQIAQEQQVALEVSIASVEDIEDNILNPMLEWFYDMDAQYRDEEIEIQTFGELGTEVKMERIPPILSHNRYQFAWVGSQGFKSAQQVQQQIAFMNVLRGIPPQLLNGRRVDITPIIDNAVETIFGPRLAPRVLLDERDKLMVDPHLENGMMLGGIAVHVHQMDDDPMHMQVHFAASRMSGDPTGLLKLHIMAHMEQMKAKSSMALPQPQQGGSGAPGMPSPVSPGGTEPGAQPAAQRPMQQPAGAVSPDKMPLSMPRKG